MSFIPTVKESIKTALAMTIAYGIALSMNWDKPYWAGFAIAFVSLSSIGQSLNKAALRMCGTLAAMVVSLTLIALFAQDRWDFMLGLSLITGVCCYMMSGKKHPYFWQTTGFITVIICIDAGPNASNAFQLAVLRAQETGLGVLVYTLVALFIWPSHSRASFDAAVVNLASLQHQLYQACIELSAGRGDVEAACKLKAQAVQAKTGFDQQLEAAQTDNYEVWDAREQWRSYQVVVTQLMEEMERWWISIAEAKALDLPRLLPEFNAFDAELDRRLELIENALAGDSPDLMPQPMQLAIDETAVSDLPYFDRAALAVLCGQLRQLEKLTRLQVDVLGKISGFGDVDTPIQLPPEKESSLTLDLDRLLNTGRYLSILWTAFLALVYIGDIPGGASFVTICVSIGLAIANMPQIPISTLFKPVATSVAFAGALYIFVMPQLSSFMGLGLMIFLTTFAICYLFAAPRQMLGRAFGLSMFIVIASISNQQTYNFLSFANTAMMFPLLFLVLGVTAYIPVSTRPERVFMRLLGRFFRSSEYLVSAMRWDPSHPATRLERFNRAIHAREVVTLPAKLATWAPHLDKWVLSSSSVEQVQALITSLQLLSSHLQQLLAERDTPQAPFLVQQLLEDFRAWRTAIQASLLQLEGGSVPGNQEALRTRLDDKMDVLEARIKVVLDAASGHQFSNQEAESFYRLLGAYRGVSNALVDYVGDAAAIDWAPWHQERFA